MGRAKANAEGTMGDVRRWLEEGIQHHRAGMLDLAEACYRRALDEDVENPDALHLMGLLALQVGAAGAAVDLIEAAVQLRPEVAEFHYHLGLARQEQRFLETAAESYRRALALAPEHHQARNNLGLVMHQLGRAAEAIAHYEEALRLDPTDVRVHTNLGNALAALDRPQDALAAYEKALSLDADHPAALANFARVSYAIEQYSRAEAAYRRLLQIDADSVEAWNDLGLSLEAQGRWEEARQAYEEALARDDSLPQIHSNLGALARKQEERDVALDHFEQALKLAHDRPSFDKTVEIERNFGLALAEAKRIDDARDAYTRALRLEPGDLFTHVRRATLCPAVFDDEAAIDVYRGEVLAELGRLRGESLSLETRPLAEFGGIPSFEWPFHGRDDRELRERLASVYRSHLDAGTAATPASARTGMPHLGFVVTANERGFSTNLLSLLNQFPPGRYRMTIVTGPRAIAPIQAEVAHPDIDFLPMPADFDRLVAALRDARFDLLYYREIGTSTLNYFLPFFRLAPIQVNSFGIQVTSGLATVDYYISSALAEPENAADHYTEELVLLPTLHTCKQRARLNGAAPTRDVYGFTARDVLFVAPHQLGKFQPQYDPVLRGILEGVPAAKVVIPRSEWPIEEAALTARWQETLGEFADRIVFVDRPVGDAYHGLLRLCDVALDTFPFGGMNTAYDCFSWNLPLVTTPGAYHRGRYVAACYDRIGLQEKVSPSIDAYIATAIDLGSSADLRATWKKEITAASDALFDDRQVAVELERTLAELLERGPR